MDHLCRTVVRNALLFALGGLAATAWAQQGPPPAAVSIAVVTEAQLAPTINVPGTVISRDDARLSAEVAGRLTWVADVGTPVEQGEAVARIEDTTLLLQQAEYTGLVTRESARLTFLVPEVERLRQLAAQDNLAKSQLDQTTSDMEVARSDLVVAQARLKQIEYALARTRIEAPFSGTVTEKIKNIGERVTIGDEVARLISAESVEIVARAPLQAVNFLDVGGEVGMYNDFRSGSGIVRTIVPFGNPESHMFEVRIDVSPTAWIIGESLRVSVPTAEPQAVIAVPRDALVLRREGTSVYKIKEDETAERVSVVTGLGDGSLIQVTGDLQPGDRVVIRGAERLRPGQPVSIVNQTEETMTAAGGND